MSWKLQEVHVDGSAILDNAYAYDRKDDAGIAAILHGVSHRHSDTLARVDVLYAGSSVREDLRFTGWRNV